MSKINKPTGIAALACFIGVTAVVAHLGGLLPSSLAVHQRMEDSEMPPIAQNSQRQDGRTCREVVENDRKITKCCKTWMLGLGVDCVYN